VYNRKIIFQN